MTGDLFAPARMTAPFELHQGDATAWLRSLEPGSLDLIVTDPAYESLEKHRAKGTTTRLKVSDASSNEWFEIFPNARFPEFFAACFRALANDRHLYVLCDQETAFEIKPMGEAAGFKFWKPLVWDKQTIGMGYHYRSRYELVLFFEKGKRRLNDLGTPDVLAFPRVRKGCQCKEPQWTSSTPRGGGRNANQKDICRSESDALSASSMCSSGSESTGLSLPGSTSTIGTTTERTGDSKTSSSYPDSTTSGSTSRASISETACGGDDASPAESGSPSIASTGTSSMKRPSRYSDVALATSATPPTASVVDVCATCGRTRAPFPTEKPVGLLEVLVSQSTQPGEIVADPFMGSGSAGEASLKLGRKFRGNDLSSASLALATARLQGIAANYHAPTTGDEHR